MILVTGATGRTGNQIVRVLRSAGLDTRCLVRKGSEYYWLNDTGASYFFGDLRDPVSLNRALRDVKHLIVASGVRLESTDNHHGNVTQDGHIALFDAAKARGVAKVVFISCMGVAHPEATGMRHLKAAEDHLIASGLPYTILRPGLYAANFADLARRVEHNGSTFLPGRPDVRVSPVHGRDLALLALACLEHPDARNQILEVGGAETVTVKEAFDLACSVAGLEPHSWPMPPAALRVASGLLRPLGRRWQHRMQSLEAWFSHDSAVDGPALYARFGLPLTPLRDALGLAWEQRYPGDDPDARNEKVVHRQFTSIIYEPGVVKLRDLPQGPPPRRD